MIHHHFLVYFIKKTSQIFGVSLFCWLIWQGVPKNLFPLWIEEVSNAQGIENSNEIADKLEKQGIQQLQQGNTEGTIQAWQQALSIYERHQNYSQIVRLMENFGLLFIQLKNYPEATRYLEKGLLVAQNLENLSAQASILQKLGQVYREQKQTEKAAIIYQQLLTLSKQLNDQESQITALGNLGDLYSKVGNYTLAIENYTGALNLSQEIQDQSKQAVSLQRIADAYYFLGNCEYAQAFYEWGLMIAEKINEPNLSLGLYQNLGNAAFCQGKFELAIKNYQQGLNLAKTLKLADEQGELIGNIGLVNIHLGNYEQAIAYLKQDLETARQNGNRLVEAQGIGSLGDAYYFQGNYPQALNLYQQSLAIAQQIKYQRGIAMMLTNIGATLLKLNQLPEAERNLKQGIEVFSQTRSQVGDNDENKLAITEGSLRSYRLLQTVLVQQNKLEEALEIAEAGRNRTFVELLAKKSNQISDLSPSSFKKIQQIATEKQSTLVEYSLIYDHDQYKNNDLKLYIWVVQPTGKLTFKLVNLTSEKIDLSALINNNRKALNNGNQTTKRLEKLYQILIVPIANQLPNDPQKNIIFVPQEELFLVPFVALKDANKYLIENHTILTAPSIQFLQLVHSQTTDKGDIVVVGNPTMPFVQATPKQRPERLENLPGTETEAKAIAEILNTKAIIGSEANKANLIPKFEQSRIIHLATHGLLEADSNGLLSDRRAGYGSMGAIALAPEGNDTGLLSVDEIMNFKLNADLVVLSACDTGRGKITGDGVVGLSRSFLSAGAKSLIVSLWSLPDLPTADLMTEFYRQWQQTPDKAQALRQAMLKTKEKYPNPRDWAAFTLIGETRTLKQ